MRSRLAVAAALTVLIATVPATSHADSSPIAHQAKKKAGKGKRKKCRKGKVQVTLNGRRRCQSLRAALPKPKAADTRLLAVEAALGVDLGKIRDRRGRRAVSAAKLLGKKKTRTAQRAVKQGLAVLEQLRTRTALATISSTPVASASARRCGPPTSPELTKSYKGGGFDAQVQLDQGAAQIGVDLGEGGVRAEIDLGLCDVGGDKFKAQDCPDAEGQLEASDESLYYVNLRIFKGGELLFSQNVEFSAETKIKPVQVDDDAKLEYFDIEHTYRTSIEVGGSSQAFGPVSMRLTYHGQTRVNFPGATYDPTNTDVDVQLRIAGAQADELHEVRDMEFDQALKAKREADENFAAAVEKAIGKLEEKEAIWNQPNRCAKIEFNPAADTLTLKRNQKGSFTARTDAQKGGAPGSAKWTLLDSQNALVGPGKALANPATFSYTVLNAGKDVIVSATFKSVSRAGVAERKWTQKTEDLETINHLIGNFSGEIVIPTLKGPSVQSWSGGATLDRSAPAVVGGATGPYTLSAGSVTYHLSGQEGLGVTACQWSGTRVVALPAGAGSGSAGVFGAPPDFTAPPYEYSIRIVTPPLEEITFTRHSCPEGAEEEEGKEVTIPFLVEFNTETQTSADGIDYSGSREEKSGGATITQSWVFKGEP